MKAVRLAMLVCLASVAVGCGSSVTVNHDWDREANFGAYRTFAWLERSASAPGGSVDNAVNNDTLLEKRIQRAVNAQLQSKGMSEDTQNPDVLLTYYLGLKDKVDVQDWGYSYRDAYWGYGGRQIDVIQYQEGNLIIDVIETSSKELVWRAAAKGTVDDNPSTEKVDRKINEVVAKMLEGYPPVN